MIASFFHRIWKLTTVPLVAALTLSAAASEVSVTLSPHELTGEPFLKIAPSATRNLNWFFTDARGQLNHRDLGQTFLTPGSADVPLRALALQIASVPEARIGENAGGGRFTLTVSRMPGPDIFEPGEALYKGSGQLPEVLEKGAYLLFDLGEALSLEKDQYYSILLSFDAPIPGQNLHFTFGPSSLYREGGAFIHSNATAPFTVMQYDTAGGTLQMFLFSTPPAAHAP